MRTVFVRRPGQSMITVAVFLAMLFTMTGFAVDGGLFYAQRRLMQNTADAACLTAANQLSLGKTDAEARTAAQSIITDNLGAEPGAGVNAPGTLSYAAIGDVYNNNALAGSGAGLTHGIEINGADVRVALASPATTFFLRAANVNGYTVQARAHCNSVAAGGATPFAVSRWRGFDDKGDVEPGLTTNQELPQFYKQGKTTKPMTVRDILAAAGSSTVSQWPGWGGSDYPGNPATGTALYSAAATPASPSNPGIETVIAGTGAQPNEGDTSFSGPIVLDYRQITFPEPLFYNGLTPDTSLNVYKDFATRYLLGPYPGPNVIPGQQLGFYSGVSAGQIQKPFDVRYNVGDTIVTLVYNGTIYTNPNFAVSFPNPASTNSTTTRTTAPPAGTFPTDCDINPSGKPNLSDAYLYAGTVADAGSPATLHPATYKFTITPENASRFKMRALFSADPAGWNNAQGRWDGGAWQSLDINSAAPELAVGLSGRTATFELQQSKTGTCTAIKTDPISGTTITTTVTLPVQPTVGAQTIYLESQDVTTGKRRGRYAFVNLSGASNDFYAFFPGELAYEPFEPGKPTVSSQFNIQRLDGTSLFVNNTAVQTSFQWFTTEQAAIGTPAGLTAAVSFKGGKNYLDITAGNSAATGKEYYLRIAVTYGGRTHWAWYYIEVRPPLNNSKSINQFVYALGYAQFKITYVDSNTIKGTAISGLMRPENIKVGLQPRLVPWE